MRSFDVRTDLALEARESKSTAHEGIPGVRFQSWQEGSRIHISRVLIHSPEGALRLGKACGTYLTIEAENLTENDGGYHREVSRILSQQLHGMIRRLCQKEHPKILTVGLGNEAVTSDSLGPKVASQLFITRNLYPDGKISSLSPGVMAQTGMEAAEIILGVVRETTPDLVLVVDALAARSVSRLGTTIQISDAGICPGSGVGNHRHGLTHESLGVPVIALGAPTVISAAAIVCDTLEILFAQNLILRTQEEENPSEEETFQWVREQLEPAFGPMFVTPKDVDDAIRRLSFTISEGLNLTYEALQ